MSATGIAAEIADRKHIPADDRAGRKVIVDRATVGGGWSAPAAWAASARKASAAGRGGSAGGHPQAGYPTASLSGGLS
jgi:hypothetical protein